MLTIVTGGAGFLGRAVVRRLVGEGRDVLAIDDFSTPGTSPGASWGWPGHAPSLPEGMPAHRLGIHGTGTLRWLRMNLADPRLDVEGLLYATAACHPERPGIARGISEVWHLASPASPALYKRRQRETLRLGGRALDALLGLAARAGARLLYASSSEVYGDPMEHPQGEHYRGNVSTTGPRSCYDEAKRYGEALCAAWHAEEGVDARIARPFNTYGPGMHPADGRLVTALLAAGITGEPFRIHAPGTQTRSLSYVDDTVEGLVAIMRRGSPAWPVNVGGDREHTIRELVEVAGRVVGHPIPTIDAPAQDEHDPMRRAADLRRLRSLGWESRIGLEEGLRRTLAWLLESGSLSVPIDSPGSPPGTGFPEGVAT